MRGKKTIPQEHKPSLTVMLDAEARKKKYFHYLLASKEHEFSLISVSGNCSIRGFRAHYSVQLN